MSRNEKILLFGKKCTLELLISISKTPKRFKDLSKVCPNERTRSKRIKQLMKANWITTISLNVKDRHFVHYELTRKGQNVVEELTKLKRII